MDNKIDKSKITIKLGSELSIENIETNSWSKLQEHYNKMVLIQQKNKDFDTKIWFEFKHDRKYLFEYIFRIDHTETITNNIQKDIIEAAENVPYDQWTIEIVKEIKQSDKIRIIMNNGVIDCVLSNNKNIKVELIAYDDLEEELTKELEKEIEADNKKLTELKIDEFNKSW